MFFKSFFGLTWLVVSDAGLVLCWQLASNVVYRHSRLRVFLPNEQQLLYRPVHGARSHEKPSPPRHLIFTASFLAFYTFAGWSSYSPTKAALRSLSDTLSQEANLYATANPKEPEVRVHTIFPAGILTEGFDAENRIKSDLTKLLEGGKWHSVVIPVSLEWGFPFMLETSVAISRDILFIPRVKLMTSFARRHAHDV